MHGRLKRSGANGYDYISRFNGKADVVTPGIRWSSKRF